MNFNEVKLPNDMLEILDVLFRKAQKINPELNESKFIERIIAEWLEPYRWDKSSSFPSKDKVVLRNNLKTAIKRSGKTQVEVAREVGIDRTYLGEIIKGKYEPSIKLGLLLSKSLGFLINDLFYLEPVTKE